MSKPPRNKQSTTLGAAASQSGPYPILDLLHELGIPITRENYLEWSLPGQDPRVQMDPEAELDMPPELRLGFGPESRATAAQSPRCQ
jgi:hypothetical protein